MKRIFLMVGTIILLASAPARADDEQVLQIKQAFEPTSLTVSAGAKVAYVNADDVNHNLHQNAPDGTSTDMGVTKPGESVNLSFASVGLYTITCSIHPRMKMKVTVAAK